MRPQYCATPDAGCNQNRGSFVGEEIIVFDRNSRGRHRKRRQGRRRSLPLEQARRLDKQTLTPAMQEADRHAFQDDRRQVTEAMGAPEPLVQVGFVEVVWSARIEPSLFDEEATAKVLYRRERTAFQLS